MPGREAKIRFLESFPGIGPKYARNMMMDVYHEDFRDSIALDVRINVEHEAFYRDAAREAGLNGWELDRLLFNYQSQVMARLGVSAK